MCSNFINDRPGSFFFSRWGPDILFVGREKFLFSVNYFKHFRSRAPDKIHFSVLSVALFMLHSWN